MDIKNTFSESSDTTLLLNRINELEAKLDAANAEIEKNKSIRKYAAIAYSIHKIVLDENNNPIDFIWIEVNSAYEKTTKLKREDIIGKRGLSIIPNLEKKWIDAYGKVALGGEPINLIDHSEYLDKYWRIKAFSDEKYFFTVILEDITETQKAELKLLGSEIRFQNIVQSSPMGMLLYKMDENENLIFQGANLAADKILKVGTRKFIGKKIEEAFPPLAKTEIPLRYKNAAKKGESWYTEQVEYCDNDISGAYEVHAFQTEPNNMAVLFNDITNRKVAEKKMLDSEKKLNALFQAMTEVVVLHELVFDENNIPVDYILIDCNDAFEKMACLEKSEILGKKASEFYGTGTAPYLEEYSNVAITQIPHEFNTYYPPMDKHFLISVVAPQPNQFATISSDVTTIKEIEERLRNKNAELENYLYVASHDLRSPLVNIQGFSQRLQMSAEELKAIYSSKNIEENSDKLIDIFDVEIPKTLNFIFTAVEKMDKLIKGLLQISRTGRIKLNIKKLNMTDLIKKIADTVDYQISELNGEIIIEDLSECYGDQDQVNQLFSNLISNAIKYHDKDKKVIIKISSEHQFRSNIYKITDNGIGLEERHLDRIWDVFYQVNPVKYPNSEGLGLSIVKRIVDKHKGKIWVDSQIGVGTTFYVKLKNESFVE